MSVLVIGGSGFIGRALIRRLVSGGHDVVATSRSVESRFRLEGLRWQNLELKYFSDDCVDLSSISVIYHLGWSTVPSIANSAPAADLADNVVGSIRLLDVIRRSERNIRLIFASSGGTVYGPTSTIPAHEDLPLMPISAYGLSKATVERYIDFYVQNYALDAITLRIGNPFGFGQASNRAFGAVTTFCANAVRRRPIVIFGDGKIVRDYLHVDDLVDALIAAAAASTTYRHFNIGSGSGISLNEIVRLIADMIGRPLKVEYQPQRAFDVSVSVLAIDRATLNLGWRPKISFREGLSRTLSGIQQLDVQL